MRHYLLLCVFALLVISCTPGRDAHSTTSGIRGQESALISNFGPGNQRKLRRRCSIAQSCFAFLLGGMVGTRPRDDANH